MKQFKTAVTAFLITLGAFCSLLFTLGILIVPARVGSPEIFAGESLSGVDYASAPDPVSIKVLSSCGGILLYLDFRSVSVDVYLSEDASALRDAETDRYIEFYDGFAGRLCDRMGGLTLVGSGGKETYFGPALEQYLKTDPSRRKLEEITAAFFEKISNTGLSSEDFAFIIENGRTDLNFPFCYDMMEYLPELFANCNFR